MKEFVERKNHLDKHKEIATNTLRQRSLFCGRIISCQSFFIPKYKMLCDGFIKTKFAK